MWSAVGLAMWLVVGSANGRLLGPTRRTLGFNHRLGYEISRRVGNVVGRRVGYQVRLVGNLGSAIGSATGSPSGWWAANDRPHYRPTDSTGIPWLSRWLNPSSRRDKPDGRPLGRADG